MLDRDRDRDCRDTDRRSGAPKTLHESELPTPRRGFLCTLEGTELVSSALGSLEFLDRKTSKGGALVDFVEFVYASGEPQVVGEGKAKSRSPSTWNRARRQ